MATKPVHRLVLNFLQSCVDGAHQNDECEARLYDSNGSKYLLTRNTKIANLITLSVSINGFRDNKAVAQNIRPIQSDLQQRYGEVCVVTSEQKAYQFVLELNSDKLKRGEAAYRETVLHNIAAVQSYILGWPLR